MSNEQSPGHAIPKSTIVGSYFALLFLAAVMICLSRIDTDRFGVDWMDLHAFKACLIMGIALVMGIIVSMFLMGLRYESKLLNLTIFLSNFVFLLIFVLFTWVDTSFRGEVDPSFTQQINFTSPVKVEEGAAGGHGEAGHGPASASGAAKTPTTAPGTAPVDSSKGPKQTAPSTAPATPAAGGAPAPAPAP
ncbi:MAG TPA: hypothetical protein VJ385_12930, partial [Fibrobacteria bacterium]|nr:hypothetical protein [Fibrobacteria bacterium]